MTDLKFQNYSQEDRLRLLEDNCDEVRAGFTYVREMTQAEILQAQEDLAEYQIKITKLQEKLKKVSQEIRSEIKPNQLEARLLIDNLDTRSLRVECTAYIFRDHEEGEVLYYNEEGVLVETRRMMPHERQFSITSQIRDGKE